MSDDPADAESLWLETLQQVTARAAHELKGALNGVSVNLEVVRGRSAQAELPASALARFAASAATQLDHVIEMNEALLSLGRRPRDPADIAATLRSLAALLEPAAKAAGAPVAVAASPEVLPVGTTARSAVVRVVLGQLLLAMSDAGGGEVRVRPADGAVAVDAVGSKGRVEIDERVAALAAAEGIRSESQGATFTLTFPAPAPSLAQRGTATHGMA